MGCRSCPLSPASHAKSCVWANRLTSSPPLIRLSPAYAAYFGISKGQALEEVVSGGHFINVTLLSDRYIYEVYGLAACSTHVCMYVYSTYLSGVQVRVGIISHGTGFGVVVGTLWIQVVKVLCPVKWV